jgi:hypothetical protein
MVIFISAELLLAKDNRIVVLPPIKAPTTDNKHEL